jgi:DNA-binding NarL/FixJ family response regulator
LVELQKPFYDKKWRASLIERETEVVSLLPEGLTNKAIAEQLRIAKHTVEIHLDRIFGKLQVKSRTEAVCKFLLDQE